MRKTLKKTYFRIRKWELSEAFGKVNALRSASREALSAKLREVATVGLVGDLVALRSLYKGPK